MKVFNRESPEIKEAKEADYMPTFRYGIVDDTGYVYEMHESNSKATFAKLTIDPRTKPFRYPAEEGNYISVYLMGKDTLDKKYSYDGIYLSADLCYSNFELSGSLIGKLAEIYQRVGEIKASLDDDFSLKANLFLVLMCILGGVGTFYAIGRLVFH